MVERLGGIHQPVDSYEDGLRWSRMGFGEAQRGLLVGDVLSKEQHAVLQRNNVRRFLQQQLKQPINEMNII